MKKKKLQAVSPSRWAAWITAVLLIVGAVISILLYNKTSYRSLLLLGILQLLPAVLNLLVYLPIVRRQERESSSGGGGDASAAQADAKEQAVEPEEAQAADEDRGDLPKKPKRLKALGQTLLALMRRCGAALGDFYVTHRNPILAALLLAGVIGFNVYFWVSVRAAALPGLLSYLVPVLLAVLFVAYIVLDKWCKHTTEKIKPCTEDGEPTPEQASAYYDRAVLNSLRGALSVARLALIAEIAIIMLRMLGLVDWSSALIVILSLLFVYETVFLLISLAVRLIRCELSVTPELTVPMPGLGGEDLGIISYLEKNTGITMRSLWSIRLIGRIVPYALMSIVLLLWGFSGVVKIDAQQQGAHYRLGVLQDELLEPGLHMTLPWPFDTVEVYDTKVLQQTTIGYIDAGDGDNLWTEEHGGEEFLLLTHGVTTDEEQKESYAALVAINMRVEYVIDDLHTYLTQSAAPESLMEAAAYELIMEKIIYTDIDSLLSIDRVSFVDAFQQDLSERATQYGTGLRIVSVVLESIHPPVDVAHIYHEVVNASIQAARLIADANGEAEVMRIEAETYKETTKKAAEIQQVIDVAEAHAAVAEFAGSKAADEQYTSAYRYYKYLNAVRKGYSKGQIILVGDGVDTGKIYIGNIGQ